MHLVSCHHNSRNSCYAELPRRSICQLLRREGIDAIFVSRWRWDGRVRRPQADPERRFPEAAPSP